MGHKNCIYERGPNFEFSYKWKVYRMLNFHPMLKILKGDKCPKDSK
jgi:hypothetical protein